MLRSLNYLPYCRDRAHAHNLFCAAAQGLDCPSGGPQKSTSLHRFAKAATAVLRIVPHPNAAVQHDVGRRPLRHSRHSVSANWAYAKGGVSTPFRVSWFNSPPLGQAKYIRHTAYAMPKMIPMPAWARYMMLRMRTVFITPPAPKQETQEPSDGHWSWIASCWHTFA